MGFVYRVLWVVKALWIVLSETINILRNLQKQTFLGCPREFCHMFIYIAPSRGHSLLTPSLPFKVILRRFEVVFWCLEWDCVADWWKFIQIHQYYTTALMKWADFSFLFSKAFDNLYRWRTWFVLDDGGWCGGAGSTRPSIIVGDDTELELISLRQIWHHGRLILGGNFLDLRFAEEKKWIKA